MKLSEAIRLGAMMKPQAFNDGTLGASCALQAAAEVLGVDRWDYLEQEYPFTTTVVECPECAQRAGLFDTLWHLNDDHRWTRERIADFVFLHESLSCEEGATS
jgi:hypothetical protein